MCSGQADRSCQSRYTLTAASVCQPSGSSTVCSVAASVIKSRSSTLTVSGPATGNAARHSGHSGLRRCTDAMHCMQPLWPAKEERNGKWGEQGRRVRVLFVSRTQSCQQTIVPHCTADV